MYNRIYAPYGAATTIEMASEKANPSRGGDVKLRVLRSTRSKDSRVADSAVESQQPGFLFWEGALSLQKCDGCKPSRYTLGQVSYKFHAKFTLVSRTAQLIGVIILTDLVE